jgi:glycosyltransferase involved in cell wall biosynthesis
MPARRGHEFIWLFPARGFSYDVAPDAEQDGSRAAERSRGDGAVRVLLLSRYGRMGASTRVRSLQYLPHLTAAGIEVTVSPLLGDGYLRDRYAGRRRRPGRIAAAYLRRLAALPGAGRYDVVWLEYELWPWVPALGEEVLAGLGVPYVADYDDAVFHRYEAARCPLTRAVLGGKMDRVMRRAAAVTAGNRYLAARAREAGARRVEVVPSVVDLGRYVPGEGGAPGGPVVLGWIGSPTTAKYMAGIADALREVCRGGRARVVMVGAGPVDLEGVPLEVRPWAEETEVEEIRRFDVGLMPLADTPWERGKCGYKLIQYMGCARPVVASPVGVNREIVEEGENGFLAASPGDWVRHLRRLCEDAELRARLGRAGRERVRERYSLGVTAPVVAQVLREGART